MAEIVNVTAQLGEIVSGMGVPLLSGGPLDDYLSCVAAGLIQFVCVREGRELYRSLTADRILIHPGSVMFRENPQYIVAGEIIRTTRMYAMSVSPLSRQVLEKLSPELFAALSGRAARGEARPLKARDFTNTVKIGSEVFEIETFKGKKTVILPWERLARVKDSLPAGRSSGRAAYKGLRGTVTINGAYTLLAEEKLTLILKLVPSLEVDGALTRVWPRKTRFQASENLPALLEALPLLVTPAIWKPNARGNGRGARGGSPGKADRKELGFICLFTDGAGGYRFKCCRGFHTSLGESLASLETLIDELGEDVNVSSKHIVNQTYRRLSEFLE
jgi:hypothetical protein